jgi:hypothetical protein
MISCGSQVFSNEANFEHLNCYKMTINLSSVVNIFPGHFFKKISKLFRKLILKLIKFRKLNKFQKIPNLTMWFDAATSKACKISFL